MSSRPASHAGSWYESKASVLSSQLHSWLSSADKSTSQLVRCIISPHAGFSYSGPTAAYSYKHMNPSTIKRIFILGPSHHHHTNICELSRYHLYNTPLSTLTLDQPVITQLKQSNLFSSMSTDVDEQEHSIEMQLPFISYIMSGHSFTIVPILVGSLSGSSEQQLGKLLSPYLSDPNNFFVISSDFCHWGSRFHYTHYDSAHGQIYESITALDREGMTAIESKQPATFQDYQEKYQNTICGRHPIAVLLNMINEIKDTTLKQRLNIKFIHYAQSNQVKKKTDSSVSYAAAIVYEAE